MLPGAAGGGGTGNEGLMVGGIGGTGADETPDVGGKAATG